jgi:uncharacterized SAM-binding protein YcdF (DUF218 family)
MKLVLPRLSRWSVAVLVGALALVALSGFLWLRADALLVEQDAFDHADVAVVLAGERLRRVLGGRDLYQAGRVGRILLSREPVDAAIGAELARLGLPDENALGARLLVLDGVDPAHVAFLEPSDSTIMEAQRTRAYFGGTPPPTLVVVTQRHASRRACFVFREVLPATRIYCAPTPYDRYATGQWWANRTYPLIVATEYLKLAINALELRGLGRGAAAPPG